MIDAYCVPGALCGEALEFLGLFRKEIPSGIWGGASKSPPSLRSVRLPGWVGVMCCVRLFRPHPALARPLPHPGEGLGWVRLLKKYLLTKVASCQKIDAVSKSHGTAAVAFPRVGKVARSAG